MKNISLSTLALSFAMISTNSFASSENLAFQVEVPGHIVDGVHEIVTVRNLENGYEVVKSDGTYDWGTGDLTYKATVIGSRLRCHFSKAEDLETLTCSRNDMPVDGIKLDIKFACALDSNIPKCDVLKTVTYVDRIQKKLVIEETIVLENANRSFSKFD